MRVFRAKVIGLCVGAIIGLAAPWGPAAAEMPAVEYDSATRAAKLCGSSEVYSGVCDRDLQFTLQIRKRFLASLQRRGATLDQLKEINWAWQIQANKEMDRLTHGKYSCPDTAAAIARRKATITNAARQCADGGLGIR